MINRILQKCILLISFILINNYANGQNYFLKKYSPDVIGQYFYGRGIYELPNKGFAMVARDSYSGGWILLTDSTGKLLLIKHLYGFAPYMNSELDDFLVLNDGNYLVVGDFFYTSGQTYRGLIKMDTLGNVIWGKHLGNGGWVSRDFFVKHSNGKQSLVIDNSSNYGIIISNLDDTGNIISSMRIQDSLNRTINVKKVKPLKNNGFVLGGSINLGQPFIMALDSSFNKIFSVSFPDFYRCEEVIPTKDNGFLCLFRDSTIYYSYHIIKTDSLGIPLWTKTFTDSLKLLFPQLLYENDENTFYNLTTWKDVNSPYYNYKGVIFQMDSLGNITSIKDSMIIQSFLDIKKTSTGKLSTLLAIGTSNSNRPAMWMTDTTFIPTTSCIQFKSSTAISQSNSFATEVNMALKFFNYSHSPQVFNVLESSPFYNYTFTCFPSGINCNTKFNTMTITSCESYIHPGQTIPLTINGTYSYTYYDSLGCDSIVIVNLSIINNSTSQINVAECSGYISPSGNYTWTTSGVYNDTLVNLAGCDSIITINLNINSVNTSITSNLPTLIANANNASYQWMYCDSVIIPGQTNQNFTTTTNGSYAVIVSENGCTDTSLCYSVFITRVNELHLNNELYVSPNPANNTITIKYLSSSNLNFDIKIFDFTGREVYSLTETIRQKELNKIIDVSEFPEGIYIIQVRNSEKLLRTKFVKQ